MIEIIDTISKLSDLEPDWRRLGEGFDSPLLQFDWFLSCAKTLHNESDLRVLVLKTNENVQAIAPLVLHRHRFTKWLEVLGAPILHEPTGILYDSSESLVALLKGILGLGMPINLSRISDSSPIVQLLPKLLHMRGLQITRPAAGSYYVTTNTDWGNFYTSMGKKWRGDFRNKRSRAEKLGKVEFECGCPDNVHLTQVMEKVIDIEANSWKGRQGSSLRDNRQLRNFFLDYVDQASSRGILRACFFNINGKAIAMNLGVEFANKLWFYKTGYNDEWSRVSPGMQLNHECIKFAFSKNLSSYEFLGSEESWQQAWPVDSHNFNSIIILPYTLKGIRGFFDIVLEYGRKRLFNKF